MSSFNQFSQLANGTSTASDARAGFSNAADSQYQSYRDQSSAPNDLVPAADMAPQFGATFVPGGIDDYYMPEVIAPSPQRVTPQVPQNMQDGIQRMELEAGELDAGQAHHVRQPSLSTYMRKQAPAPQQDSFQDTDVQAYQRPEGKSPNTDEYNEPAPSFSPFPKIKGSNVPPTDDEKEEILWNARKHVLHSQNVSMQIVWARDVLMWAEVAQDAAAKEDRPRASTPRIEHELRMDALNIVNYLAGQEHPDALYMKSKWLEFGKFGNRVDKREAYTGYKRAADLGHARSEYRMGMLFEQSNDMSKAKEHYYKGMSLNDSAALYRMGMMSLLGQHGEAKDYPTALERIQAAADGADEDAPQGSYVYGMLAGRDLPDISIPESILPQNTESAKTYVEKAAYLGFAKAQLKMGQAYELCQFGCEFNASYSLHYYGLAAKQGLPEAALGVSRWFLFGFEGVFKKNEELAFKFAHDAAVAKLPTGAFAMGYYHEIGIHVNKDIVEAKKWYQIAADQGNKDAASRLDSLNQDQSLSKQDHETTTLGRIKSQHGSQRGQRPERFRKSQQQMPTLNENSTSTSPAYDNRMPPSYPPTSSTTSPRVSPPVSPGMPPPHAANTDPSRPPAFNIRLDPIGGAPPPRPHSAAPYPEDDQPARLDVSRPRSTAPYPDDNMQQGGGPARLNPHAGQSQGPIADRPMSAFGINTQGAPGQRPMPSSQSMGNLQPSRQPDPRGRVVSTGWDAQRPPAGYRQPSPGPPGPGMRPAHDMQQGRPVSAQPYPSGPPVGSQANRLHKQPPKQYAMSPGPGRGQPPPPAGTDPRMASARPMSDVPAPHAPGPRMQNHDRFGAGPPAAASRPERLSSAAPGSDFRQSGASPAGGPGWPPGPHSGGRAGTAPPVQASARPELRPTPSSTNSTASAPPKAGKPGPATFDDMGIPHAKKEGDCVVM